MLGMGMTDERRLNRVGDVRFLQKGLQLAGRTGDKERLNLAWH
jgi:hypothetical protein